MKRLESPQADMAQVMRTFLPTYRQHYRLSPQQASACQSILQCQTEALGGEQWHCEACGYEQLRYHSCGNRHCPQCKQNASEQWQAKQLAAVLPVRYYHLVFTLPHEFNPWCQLHPRVMYGLLFQAVWQTLCHFATNHKRLRGQLGVTAVLHTWGQNLQQHVHLHCLIPGVALKPGQAAIETTRSDYLYPVKALKKVFRGKLVSMLRAAYGNGELFRVTRPREVDTVLDTVMTKEWSVFIRPCLEQPRTVVNYLSRYTYRIAISNQRIVQVDEQSVTFRWKDYADNDRPQTMTLAGMEFLRRFLMHVLPGGFMRIRHFGFLANCVRQRRVTRLRQLLHSRESAIVSHPIGNGIEPIRTSCWCPACHEQSMRRIAHWLPWQHRRRYEAEAA